MLKNYFTIIKVERKVRAEEERVWIPEGVPNLPIMFHLEYRITGMFPPALWLHQKLQEEY